MSSRTYDKSQEVCEEEDLNLRAEGSAWVPRKGDDIANVLDLAYRKGPNRVQCMESAHWVPCASAEHDESLEAHSKTSMGD